MQKTNSNKTQDNNSKPPVVAVMGHVDHGKTSILDAIRNTHIQEKEYGGITQHIGAYQIVHRNHKITFIDTPGHAAFTQMRARGGKAADIVILVVAADSGVQPQTKEAIFHARASKATVIVAINKIDLPGADVQKVKQQLAQENILVEDWGGDVVCVEVSAKEKKNLSSLLDSILAVAEQLQLKSMPDSELEAMIIESKKDRQKGVLVTCIVNAGTLRMGNTVVGSGYKAKIKLLTDDRGQSIDKAEPGSPVEILGFKDVPNVGDLIVQEGSDLESLSIDEFREEIIGQDTKRVVSIVVRADTQGTLEAVKSSLANLVASSVGLTFSIKFLLASTGDVTDSDILLAQNGDGIVLGFNARVSNEIHDLARDLGVTVKSYKTIYDLVDEVSDLLEGTARYEEKKIKGRAQVLRTFKLPSGDEILGCRIDAGALKINSHVFFFDKNPADLTPSDEPLFVSSIKKLKIGKEDVELVGKNNECGILFKPPFIGEAKGLWLEVR